MNIDITARILRWIGGSEKPDDLATFLQREGAQYRNYRQRWAANDYQIEPYDLKTCARRWEQRNQFIQNLGFAIPCREALDLIANHTPLLEIGAGTAMWSALLAQRGADVIASDYAEHGVGSYSFIVGAHYHTICLQGKTAIRRYHDRNVFCSWPTLGHTWFRQAARRDADRSAADRGSRGRDRRRLSMGICQRGVRA